MKKFWITAAIVGILAGCGGGGGSDGDGNPGFTTTPIGINESVSGTLTASSPKAPDGTYFNLYTVTLTSTMMLTITLESPDFDVFLALFEEQALSQANLDNWDPYYLTSIGFPNPGVITTQLPAGTYVIFVNSMDPATGTYTLTTAAPPAPTLSLVRQYVQFRTYENPADNRFMAWVDYKDNGALLQPGDLLTARIYDPSGAELIPMSVEFASRSYTVAAWNPALSMFVSIGTDGDSGFSFNLANFANLTAGVYRFEVAPAIGGLLTSTLAYPGKVELPMVAAAGMNAQWNQDGSLTLSWAEPAGFFDQYRIVLSDPDGNAIFYGRAFPGTSQVTLQAALVAQITQHSQLSPATTIHWTMQTRNYVESDNYARGYSNPVPILWP